MLANSDRLNGLRVMIGNAHWNDLRQPPQNSLNVEEIYLMIRPRSPKTINIEHVVPWLTPALFPALRTFTIFQEYGVNSKVVVQLPFINGPANFQTRAVDNVDEFWSLISLATGLSNFNF